ncbi:MAG: haloalkane dehalogenase [Deltaproteobacteria bacterium]|nr:haloalkane dehalogenase [Deltaproteobacteria bacterium]
MATEPISADFPFESRYVEVHGSKIHYIDEGTGDPILFLHGNPTSSYLWRNIIPWLVPHGRCIAPDLIGMGKSDKPDIEYRFFDHAEYLEGFIEKLDLSNLTVVLHDWGSGLGFHYAMRHESNIKGIAFMEAMMKPFKWESFPADQRKGFKLFRSSFGWFMINVMNVFLTRLIPEMVVRKLSAEEMDYYKSPYKSIKSRKPVRQWPLEIPIDGQPSDVHDVILNFSQKLQDSELPKILFHADPGIAIDDKMVDWCKKNLKNLRTVDIGKGLHFIQEDNPHMIGEELADWYQDL